MELYDNYQDVYAAMTRGWTLYDTPLFKRMRDSLAALSSKLEEFSKPGPDGTRPVFTQERNEELRSLQDAAISACVEYMRGRNAEDISTSIGKTRYQSARLLLKLIENDRKNMENIDFSKGMTLNEVVSRARGPVEQVDTSTLERAGAFMSSRLHLPPTQERGEGFFTASANAESVRGTQWQVIERTKKKYPQYAAYIQALTAEVPDKDGRPVFGVVEKNAGKYGKSEEERQQMQAACREGSGKFWDFISDYFHALRAIFLAPAKREKAGLSQAALPEEMMTKQDFREMLYELRQGVGAARGQHAVREYAGIRDGSNIEKRNVAMSAVARLMGRENILARSTAMTLSDGGKEVQGVFMEKAKGLDILKLWKEPAFWTQGLRWDTPQAKEQLASMQVLDWICGNTDRHNGNLFYDIGRDGDGRLVLRGVQGIDNDNSFGNQSVEELSDENARMANPNNMGVIRETDAQAVKHLTKEQLNLMLFDLLEPPEIEAAWKRVQALQKAIVNGERTNWKSPTQLRRGVVRTMTDGEIAAMPREMYEKLPALARLAQIPDRIEQLRRTRKGDIPRKAFIEDVPDTNRVQFQMDLAGAFYNGNLTLDGKRRDAQCVYDDPEKMVAMDNLKRELFPKEYRMFPKRLSQQMKEHPAEAAQANPGDVLFLSEMAVRALDKPEGIKSLEHEMYDPRRYGKHTPTQEALRTEMRELIRKDPKAAGERLTRNLERLSAAVNASKNLMSSVNRDQLDLNVHGAGWILHHCFQGSLLAPENREKYGLDPQRLEPCRAAGEMVHLAHQSLDYRNDLLLSDFRNPVHIVEDRYLQNDTEKKEAFKAVLGPVIDELHRLGAAGGRGDASPSQAARLLTSPGGMEKLKSFARELPTFKALAQATTLEEHRSLLAEKDWADQIRAEVRQNLLGRKKEMARKNDAPAAGKAPVKQTRQAAAPAPKKNGKPGIKVKL